MASAPLGTAVAFRAAVDAASRMPTQEAQAAVMAFRSSAGALAVARGIIGESATGSANAQMHKFHAAQLMMHVVLERWEAYSSENPRSWDSSIVLEALQYATRAKERAVVIKLLTCAAAFWKRGWKQASDSNARCVPKFDLFASINQILASPSTASVGIQAILALVQEFAAGANSSSMGMPHAFHRGCHRGFEATYLLRCFMCALGVLQANVENADIAIACLTLCDACLGWRFMNGEENEGFVDVGLPTAASGSRIKPGAGWREALLKDGGAAVKFLFELYRSRRARSVASHADKTRQHLTRQVLLKLASVNGDIFGDASNIRDRGIYATLFGEFVLSILRAPLAPLSDAATVIQSFEADGLVAAAGSETLDVCAMLIRLTSNFRYPAMLAMPAEIMDGLMLEIVRLATTMLDCAVVLAGNDAGYEDSWVLEAFQHVLDFWCLMHSMCSGVSQGKIVDIVEPRRIAVLNFLVSNAGSFYEHTVLRRVEMAVRSIDAHDATCTGFEEMFEDEESFQDQMDAIALVGRIDPASSIPVLVRLIEHAFLSLSAGDASPQLSETVYWLACFAGHLLADKFDPEQAYVPESIAATCAGPCNMPAAWPSLASPAAEIASIGNNAIKLSAWLLMLLRVESAKVRSTGGADERVSPLASEKILWALARWTKTYLFQTEAGQAIHASFGSEVANLLVESACVYLSLWGMQKDVIKEANNVLLAISFVCPSDATDSVTSLPSWGALVSAHLKSCGDPRWSPLSSLEACHHGEMVCILVKTSVRSPDQLRVLVSPAEQRLQAVCNNLSRASGNVSREISSDLERLAEIFSGVARGALFGSTGERVRSFVIPSLEAWAFSAERCMATLEATGGKGQRASLWLTVSAILKLLQNVLDSQLIACSQAEATTMFTAIAKVIQCYAKCDAALFGGARLSEEDASARAEDLVTLLKILLIVADQAFCEESSEGITSSKLVAIGIQNVMPLITEDVLAFKQVAIAFFEVLTTLVKFNSEMVATINPAVFSSIKASLAFGINHHLNDIVRASLESVSALAEHHALAGGLGAQLQHDATLLFDFLTWAMNFIIYQAFSESLVDTAANAILAIIVSSNDTYQAFVRNAIEAQPPGQTRERVIATFQALTGTNGVSNDLSRVNRRKFRANARVFASIMKGLVCIR